MSASVADISRPASSSPSPRSVIRVASVPEGHVYIRNVAALTPDGVIRLADPPPRVVDRVPGQWWPPAMLSPGWVRQHAADFDVFHVHFGFDAIDPADLAAVVDALDDCGRPLVYTVHDLRNPHHPAPGAHDAQLDVLVPRAAALITLTEGAACEVAQRWARVAHVIPHPHVVDFERMSRPRPSHDGAFVVGVHAKSLRASMDPAAVVQALLPLVGELDGMRLVVDVHRDVAEPDGDRHDAGLMSLLQKQAASGRLDLAVHDCYTDAELWDYLQSLDVSVLPYRFGTHSGWLEACHDLGTTVVAPDCGYITEQRPCLAYRHDMTGLDVHSLQAAIRQAYQERPKWITTPTERMAERRLIAEAHRRLYEAVLA